MRRAVFLIAIGFCLTPWATAPIALALGLALALLGLTAWESTAKKVSRLLIQICIVLLGFSIDLRQVAQAGASGIIFAAGTILGTFALGIVLGRILRTEAKVTTLLCSGTAICGGSAIAATGSVIRASDAQMSVALAAVFSLNAIALYVFPPLGHALGMSQQQFGTWAAVAIHDMSSVVSAGHVYGDEAQKQATVVKLSRVLWIVPVSILAAWIVSRAGTSGAGASPVSSTAQPSPSAPLRRHPWLILKAIVPWFIALFLLASLVPTLMPALMGTENGLGWKWGGTSLNTPAAILKAVANQGMAIALLLIGSGLSKKALASVGWRPFVLAIVLWVAISVAALAVVRVMM